MASVNKNGLLSGKVAVITGASRGIGEAIARRYAMEGAKVVVSARTVEEGDHFLEGSINSCVKQIQEAGGEALAVKADLAAAEDRHNLISAAEDAYGPVDILVNNAAVTWFIPVADFQEKRFRIMMDVQVYAPFELSQLVLPTMVERGEGWILNVSSHAALHPEIDAGGRGGTVYGMCKAALERFTTGLASEVFDQGVAVNVISPGLVATPGVVHHKLINDTNEDRVTPVEHMAEACLRLCYGTPSEIVERTRAGRAERPMTPLNPSITYADEMIADFALEPADPI